ncbi:MAG: coproporphyrinogen dehydrogenase HemZ [Bacillota bacterium]|nr:coproporphyrinogen dehydrogenase HemZ [Bacillota bacterium]
MYRCRIEGIDKLHQYDELIKTFLPPTEYELQGDGESAADASGHQQVFAFEGDKNLLKRRLYKSLEEYTGKSPKWGIVTGIRPVKMAGELLKKTGDTQRVRGILEREFLLHPHKASLVMEILQYQRETAGLPEDRSLSLYIGIPFCPTRCLYCSFTSNQVSKQEIDRYLKALFKEMTFAGEAAAKEGWRIESLYIGGGTPTTLDEGRLQHFLEQIRSSFDLTACREFTVEAGRPDTITREKLKIMRNAGADRISINPQTMKEDTLRLIGRDHSIEDVRRAFSMAEKVAGDLTINTDLIAGLPEEDLSDFQKSLEEILALGPDNITLHTLAVKRASRLKEMDELFNYREEELREEMLAYAMKRLRSAGYRPYYLYRQKHTSGNTENLGFCRKDKISRYNIRIMEEAQSILALGAGGVSKIYFPEENRLERVANVSNYEIYIERIDEMIERKANGFFGNIGSRKL